MVAYSRGQCLYGKPLEEICEPIEQQYYLQSIFSDVKNSEENIRKTVRENVMDDPVYVILNLCRVLYYLKEGYVSSKKEGGEWGARTLPKDYRDIILMCLSRYIGTTEFVELDNNEALFFVRYAMDEIRQRLEKTIR
jgi:hypothetical protein